MTQNADEKLIGATISAIQPRMSWQQVAAGVALLATCVVLYLLAPASSDLAATIGGGGLTVLAGAVAKRGV